MPAMPITSDGIYGHQPEPYDVPRGNCPECESGAVKHLVIGDLVHPEEMETAPRWVEWVGCMHPGYDRECRHCGLTWTADEDDEPRL